MLRVGREADRAEPVHRPADTDGMRLLWRKRADRDIAAVSLGERSGPTSPR
ncbi:hypothetical protein NKH18_43180 [Streptomyces sp. M10(2022)]